MSDFEKVLKGLECCTTALGCKACPYSEKGIGTDDCQLESTQDALELLKSRKWISVKDRLPEEWESAITFQPLLSGNFGLIRIGVYIGNNKWRECEMHNMMDLPVTHWMPLPKLPEEPKEEA